MAPQTPNAPHFMRDSTHLQRTVISNFPLSNHKSPTLQNPPSARDLFSVTRLRRRRRRRRRRSDGSPRLAADAPAAAKGSRRGRRRRRRRHLLLLRRRWQPQVLLAQQLVVAPLHPRARVALAVDPRVLAQPLQEPGGHSGAARSAARAE